MEWQGVQILVPATESLRKVQWVQTEATVAVEKSRAVMAEEDAYEYVETLCSLLSSRVDSLLSFKATKGKLMVLRGAADVACSHHVQYYPSPGLHLGEVLSQFSMRHGMRPVLAYVLAKAVWYYYDSDWMSMAMAKDSIYFVGEMLDDEVAYFCKPYLSADLPPESGKTLECRQVVGMMHRYPRVLALGIIWLKLRQANDWKSTVNQQLLALKKLLSGGEFHEDCRFPRYKAAVNKCLDPMLFKNAPFNPKRPNENLERRRAILYNDVVDPLRQLIEGTGWDAELGEFEQTALTPKPRARPWLKSHTQVTVAEVPVPVAPKRNPWLDEVAVLNRMLKRERRKVSANVAPLKIAILDTGYDDSVPTFDIPNRIRRIKAWRDLVSFSAHLVDTDGHGTHLLTLLLQLECQASIYVARVTESSRTLNSAEHAIAEAIRIAITKWDVDFVSLSFGFPRHIGSIKDAIADAIHIKRGAITFFAAANNDGFNSREMFSPT